MRFNEPISVLAVRDRDRDALRRAASGGAFCVLARPVIAQGGVVFGAVMSDGGAVAHGRAEDLAGLTRMQGSAYVQSDVSGVYDEVVKSVLAGRLTLFTGLPCQCAAIGSYVTANLRAAETPANLLLCDLVCHGACGPTTASTRSASAPRGGDGASTTTTTTSRAARGATSARRATRTPTTPRS